MGKSIFFMFVIAIVMLIFTSGDINNNLKRKPERKQLVHTNLENTMANKYIDISSEKKTAEKGEKELDKLKYEINIYDGGMKLDFKKPIKNKLNRYYFPIREFSEKLGCNVFFKSDVILFSNKVELDIDKREYLKSAQIFPLRGDIIESNRDYYISLIDICEILDLTTHWDYDTKSIFINKVIKKSKQEKSNVNEENLEKKKAYIRFEDFTAGDIYDKAINLEKMRFVADYMKSFGEVFHIAWIPRYVNPEKQIDNDITKDNTINNAHFLFTLDYLINSGGVVGIHGYTHQYGDTTSIIGSEFGEKGYREEKQIRERVQLAIEVAKKLNIPYTFWESPHYSTTKEAQAIVEEYFNYLYEPYIGVFNKNIITSERNGVTKYVPTPLSYVKDKDVATMLNIMKNKPNKDLMSLYYHASKEFDYIDITVDSNGVVSYTYNDNSLLKQMVNYIKSRGYGFASITEN